MPAPDLDTCSDPPAVSGSVHTSLDRRGHGDGASLAVVRVRTGVCCVCNAPLGVSYWIVAHPQAAHTHCIDWTKRAFPYAALLRAWRSALRQRQIHARPHGECLEARAEVNMLEQMQKQWPTQAEEILRRPVRWPKR